MIKIDSLLLRQFFTENEKFLTGAKVQKIQQPTRKEIILHLRNNFESRKLYININPESYHLAFMSKDNEAKRNLQIPKQPPMFCMLLRKHMEGAKITNVQIPEFERIIEFYFENYNEIGDRVEECLSIELMGKHSNAVLYNTDTNIIIGCAHNIGSEKSKERELAGGLPYIYPPKQNKKNLLKTKSASFIKLLETSNVTIKKLLNENFYGLSQILTEEILKKSGINPDCSAGMLSLEEKKKIYIAFVEFLSSDKLSYSVSLDYEKFSCVENLSKTYANTNELIDDYFSFHIQETILKSLKGHLKNLIEKDLKKQRNNLKIQEKLLENEKKVEAYKLKADLLMSNLYNLKNIEKRVILRDFDDKTDVIIDLDENSSITENANRYYAKYNKAKKAYSMAVDFIKKIQAEIDYLEELLFSTEIASSVNEIEEIKEELIPSDKKNVKKEKTKITLDKREVDGFTIYIGKNNKQNDYIFSKVSSPSDIWMHALNITGSHILIKNPSGIEIPDNVLLYAAQLAKEYSSAKNSGKTPIIYTQRKFVKKPPGQKGGMVTYRNETEIVTD